MSMQPQNVAARDAFQAAVTAYHALYQADKDAWATASQDVYPPVSGFNYFVQQYILQSGVPTIPDVAPRKTKKIHGN